MRQIKRLFIPAVIAAAGLLAANHALAGDHRHGGGHGTVKLHIDVGHGGKHGHRGHGGHHGSRHGGHGHDARHGGYGYDCRKVSKHGYYHGRKARIGGTMCYDRYGDPYIVQGSRYVIDYYY